MDLIQLRYFVLLAEELSFTRAAVRGNVAQPALSRRIRKLEDELGVALVDRTTRRVSLTRAGEDVLRRARRVLDEVDVLRATARGAVTLLSGRLVIGTTLTPGPFDLAEAVAAFHERHPGVELSLTADLSVSLADQLRRDKLDLAVISAIPAPARAGLALVPLASEPLQIAVGPSHRLAGRRAAHLEELAQDRFVSFGPGATIRTTVDEAARAAGFTPAVVFEGNDTPRIRSLVSHGLGVAILPRSDIARPGPEVCGLALGENPLSYEVLLAWRESRRLPPPAAAIKSQLLEGRPDGLGAPGGPGSTAGDEPPLGRD